MKKTLFIAAILGLAFVSCKKDRVCSCKEVVKYTNSPVPIADQVTDYDVTLLKTTRRTAFNACIHTTESDTYNGVTETIDINCSLK